MNRTSTAACLLAASIAGCAPAPVPPPPAPVIIMPTPPPGLTPPSKPPAEPVVFLDQGWTPEVINAWYRKPQGSQLVPYDWFLALEQVDNDRPFRADEVIDRFRYLPEAPGPSNPDGLPVGFAKGGDGQGRAWLGFTCAACHTGQVEYQGKKVRIEGGPALGDLAPLRERDGRRLPGHLEGREEVRPVRRQGARQGRQARASQGAPRRDPRFLRRHGQAGGAEPSPISRGFGRVDAFTILMNEMAGTVAGEPGNYRTPVAPVSYPHLWAPRSLTTSSGMARSRTPSPATMARS